MVPLASVYSDASESPGLALWRVTNTWQRVVRAALAPFDLTHVQFVLLAALVWMDRASPVTQRELARHAETDVMMTSQVLRALERKGLVTRSPHPSDRRARALVATAEGVTLANRAIAAVEDADGRFFAALGDEREDFLRHLLALRRDE